MWSCGNKQIGIFQFDRIGAGYVDNSLSLALDAGVTLGPLSFSMIGLSVGTPLNKFEPVFSLNGLGLSFSKPPIRIGGGTRIKILEANQFCGGGTELLGRVYLAAAQLIREADLQRPGSAIEQRVPTPLDYCCIRSTTGMIAGGCASSMPSSAMTGPR